MKTTADWVLVKVDSELDTFLGIIHNEKGEEVELVLNPNWRPTLHAKISAVVVAAPQYLTDRMDPLYEKYQGSPRPIAYRGGDYILAYKMATPPKYRKRLKLPYNCGSYEPNMQTHEGLPVDTQPGDLVYFHYNNLLKTENFMYRDTDGKLVYRIPYQTLFCRVRKGVITMLNGYVLVSEYYDDSVKDIKVDDNLTVKGKTKGDLVVSVGEKPKYLSGILRHIGDGIGPDRRSMAPGAFVLFRPSSEFVNTIEGEPFYVMRQWDIIAEWLDDREIQKASEIIKALDKDASFDTIAPTGDYIMINPEDQQELAGAKLHKYDPNKLFQKFKLGELFVTGDSMDKLKSKKELRVGFGTVVSSGELCRHDYTNKRVLYEKSSYYNYVREYGLVFVREGDVLGVP